MRRLVFCIFCLWVGFSSCFASESGSFLQREDVKQFIDEISVKHKFNKKELEKLFSSVQFNKVALNSKQSSDDHPTPYYQFRAIFIQPERIEGGIQYWKKHEHVLKSVSKKYGVPVSVIVAVIGVETNYGDNEGKFYAINSLATLAFNYPPQAPFFKFELEQFLLMCRKYKLDPLSIRSSYAGAIGKLQFMPHSVMDYAIQFNTLEPLDLYHNDPDVIASIANYLNQHGWEKGKPIAVKVKMGKDFDPSKLPALSKKPDMTVAEASKFHLYPERKIDHNAKVFIVPMEGKDNIEYFLGFKNLAVLMTYNQNPRYGLVVDELSALIKKQMTKTHAHYLKNGSSAENHKNQ